jgi:hypothetical protein
VNLPMKQYGMFFQDDWRVTPRLTVNAGLRYDLVTGFLIDQSKVPNYVTLTAAAAAGRFNGVPGFDEFGKKAQEDKNNIQPRLGAVYDLRGNGKDVVRAGWGLYYDFSFTNATILFPGVNAQGGKGIVFDVNNTQGIRNPDGTFFTAGQPVSNIAGLNEVNPAGPFFGVELAAPHIRQPWTSQTSVGWSHELMASTVLDIDYVHADGHDLAVRWPLNTLINGTRRYADLRLAPPNPLLQMTIGTSRYDGLNIGVRRLMDHHVQLNAWYTLSKATGRGGLAVDELSTNLVQDATKPLDDVQSGPAARADARHKVTLTAVIEAPWGITVSPIYRYRSALPVHIWYGYDANADGVSNDIYTTAYQYTGINDTGVPSYKETGPCKTVNCGRGAALSQLNLRVSKAVPIGRLTAELIGEVFNVTNAINPAFNIGTQAPGFFTGTLANHSPNPLFMKPSAYAGDSLQTEQRVGQIGIRITF